MKPWLVLFLVLLLGRAVAEEVTLHRIYHNPQEEKGWMDYRVERPEYVKVPEWEPMPGSEVPLSRDKAVEIAKQATAASGVGEKARMIVSLEATNRYEKEILKRLPQDGCRWFYVVEFREEGKKSIFCVVTMSGAVAKAVPGGK
ncbi:hypothetical protein WKV53_15730 [Luteolibacter sp. Y139]|uniref:PepSY domain-containing protein n=2 Tax=Luteolibacter soli TaxID=3135280 RepID=A0ABU9AWC8_9BACT